LQNGGQAWAWGENDSGSLGDNTLTNRSTPVAVCGTHTFCYIMAHRIYMWENWVKTGFALDKDGLCWSWGRNDTGDLGDNTTTNRSTPVAVCGTHSWLEVYTGNGSTWAKDNSHMLWFWGYNGWFGGDYTGTNRSTPVRVCGNHSVAKFSSMRYNRMLLDPSGTIWAWGGNSYGELGRNNSRTFI